MQKMMMRRPVRTPLIAAVAGAGVLAAVTVGVLVARDDGNSTTLAVQPAAQVSSIQQGCQQWLSQDSARSRVGTPAWCTGLTDWMTDRMASTGVGPQMMFGGAAQMKATCRQWMTESPPAGADAGTGTDWCDSMTSWMSEHMGTWSGREDWDDWMMHGPMMGR